MELALIFGVLGLALGGAQGLLFSLTLLRWQGAERVMHWLSENRVSILFFFVAAIIGTVMGMSDQNALLVNMLGFFIGAAAPLVIIPAHPIYHSGWLKPVLFISMAALSAASWITFLSQGAKQ